MFLGMNTAKYFPSLLSTRSCWLRTSSLKELLLYSPPPGDANNACVTITDNATPAPLPAHIYNDNNSQLLYSRDGLWLANEIMECWLMLERPAYVNSIGLVIRRGSDPNTSPGTMDIRVVCFVGSFL